jgi:DNA mismatch endonuclease (patch repair protein)
MDRVSTEIRKKTMRAVKSKGTKLETKVYKELWRNGFRFSKNVSKLKGKPDIAIKKYKVAIFIDSCFWHGCNLHCRYPVSNQEYWKQKIEGNKIRDDEVKNFYKQNNWNILRVWEHDIKNNFTEVIFNIENFIKDAKKLSSTLNGNKQQNVRA